jgi:hypothetical protein
MYRKEILAYNGETLSHEQRKGNTAGSLRVRKRSLCFFKQRAVTAMSITRITL